MVEPYKIWGRLGNQLFIMAAHYARCKLDNVHFFVQDEKYFKEYENEIRQMFSGGIVPNSVDRVAIHRRLGDYRGNTFYVDLGHHEHQKLEDNYYIRAMAMFPKETKFTVFSDQIEIAKKEPMFQNSISDRENLAEDKFEFSERNEIEDLNYMASHQSHIIANSSFSWMGAWLGKHPLQVVIAPKQWFASLENEKFIGLPSTWLRL